MTRTKRRILAVAALVSVPSLAVNIYALLTADAGYWPWLPTVGAVGGWVALTCWALAPSRRKTGERREIS